MSATATDLTVVRVSRTAIGDRHLCPQRRFLTYHDRGHGWQPAQTPYALALGTLLHERMEQVFTWAQHGASVEEIAGNLQVVALGDRSGDRPWTDEELLAYALAYAWVHIRLPQILAESEVVSVEQEWTWRPALGRVGDTQLEIPFRMDVLLRRRYDGALFTLDFKTLTAFSADWFDKFMRDLQTLLYTHALEEVMGGRGIQFEGLVKGKRDVLKTGAFAGEPAYSSILVAPYVDEHGALTPTYKNGRRRHKLKTPEVVTEWIHRMLNNHEAVVRDQFTSVPLYQPARQLRERVLGPILREELAFAARVATVGEDPLWGMERNTGSCLKFGKDHPCPLMAMCWDSGVYEYPLDLYVPREDHHAPADGGEA